MFEEIMLLIQLAIGMLLVIPVIVNILFKRDNKLINILMINNMIFTIGIVVNSSVTLLNHQLYWSYAMFVYLLLTLVYYYSVKEESTMIVCNFILSVVLFLLPLTKIWQYIQFSELRYVFLCLTIIQLVILFIITKKDIKILRSYYLSLMLIVISVAILIPMYSILFTLCIALLYVILSCHKVIQARKNEINHVEKKLSKLENEFREELRREVNRHTFHLKEVQEKMSEVNKIDNLTKAYNRKAIFDYIEKLTDDRRLNEFSLIMFDLDHFKKLNDTQGHVKGDIALKMLTQIARECLRDTDTIGRYGGDEFLIVLPKSDIRTTKIIANRFREQIDKRSRPHYTLSMGIAHYPTDGETLAKLLISADNSLYEAKRLGRNTVAYKPK